MLVKTYEAEVLALTTAKDTYAAEVTALEADYEESQRKKEESDAAKVTNDATNAPEVDAVIVAETADLTPSATGDDLAAVDAAATAAANIPTAANCPVGMPAGSMCDPSGAVVAPPSGSGPADGTAGGVAGTFAAGSSASGSASGSGVPGTFTN